MSSDDLFVIRSKALPSSATVIAFTATEGLSKAYCVEVDLQISEEEDLEASSVVGKRATLSTTRGEAMTFNGVIAAVELMNQYAQHAIYRVTLRPRLWQLTLSEHSRVFVAQSLPDILEDVLRRAGFGAGDYELKLHGSYPTLDHVCQVRESSFDFISRWMERDGIYYYFEQGAEQEKLVITDARGGHREALPHPVRFFPSLGADVAAPTGLSVFRSKQSALPSKVMLTDYDYVKPALSLLGSAAVAANGPDTIVRYGDNFLTPDEGARLAAIRAEELLARETVFTASGSQLDLHPGHTFTLEDHPRVRFNQRYLVTDVEHHGNQAGNSPEIRRLLGLTHDEVYFVGVTSIAADVQYRPARKTTIPRIYSMENAVVDGDADSDYAQLDEHGRYRVKLKFDEGDLKNGKASMWVRMLQPHGGNPEGFHFPLRKGTEVLLIFLGGDPDRPVIAGVGPNAVTPSPVTGSNHTKNVIQTGGSNRIEMEDTEGSQYACFSTPTETTFLHMGAPRDGAHLVLNTSGDNLVNIGGDRTIRVDGDRLEHVLGDLAEKVLGDKLVKITGDVEHAYAASFKHTVDADVSQYFNADEFKKILGTQTQQIEGDLLHKVQGSGKLSFDGEYTLTVNASAKNLHNADLTIFSDGEMTLHTSSEMKIDADGGCTLTAPTFEVRVGPKIEFKHSDNTVITGEKAEVVAGASFEAIAADALEIFAGIKNEIVMGLTMTTHVFHSEAEAIHIHSAGLKEEEHAVHQLTTAMHACEEAVKAESGGVHASEKGLAAFNHALTTIN